MYTDDFTEIADMVARIEDEADIDHIKDVVCASVRDWRTDMDRIACMLSQSYTWHTSFPIWLRHNASQFNAEMMQRLSVFAKHLVFGRIASERSLDSERKAECEEGNYKYYALSDRRFFRILDRLPHDAGATFIDVGCGVGVKPLMAWLYKGYTSYGIELNAHTYELSRFFLDDLLIENWADCPTHYHGARFEGSIGLTYGDAFDYSYEQYDIIYMYRPIMDDRLVDLYRHVYSSMRDDAVMIEAEYLPRDIREAMPDATFKEDGDAVFIYKGGDNG